MPRFFCIGLCIGTTAPLECGGRSPLLRAGRRWGTTVGRGEARGADPPMGAPRVLWTAGRFAGLASGRRVAAAAPERPRRRLGSLLQSSLLQTPSAWGPGMAANPRVRIGISRGPQAAARVAHEAPAHSCPLRGCGWSEAAGGRGRGHRGAASCPAHGLGRIPGVAKHPWRGRAMPKPQPQEGGHSKQQPAESLRPISRWTTGINQPCDRTV